MQVSTSTPTTVSLSPLLTDITDRSSLCEVICTKQLSTNVSPEQIQFYEEAITADETIASNYWYLGVAYLLAEREDDAQAAWFVPLSSDDPAEIELLTSDLLIVLEQEATYQAQIPDLERAWLIRQHIRILAPDRLENILKLAILAGSIGELTSEHLFEWEIKELLNTTSIGSIDEDILEQMMVTLLDFHTQISLDIIESCIKITSADLQILIEKVVSSVFKLFYQQNLAIFAIKLGEICLNLCPDNLSVLKLLAGLYSGAWMHDRAKEVAQQYCQLAPGVCDRLFGSYLLQRAYFSAGDSSGVLQRLADYRDLAAEVIQRSPQDLNHSQRQGLLVSSFFLSYTEDNPRINKILQNQLSALYQQNIPISTCDPEFTESSLHKKTGCLRIGYIGSTFKVHSVGWLSRWLIHHHDREFFQVFMYCLNIDRDNNFNHQWFRDKVDISSYFDGHPDLIAAQIRADEIDILIDLDSLTFDSTCLVIAQKPAPIQVSWLGWDSFGVPAVDYFIADPYVLPDDAQGYYQEQIWRLPQTYLAVDGFEVGIPTLRREDLDIPTEAVVYLCSQNGYKRNPDNIRAQMKILKAVPNSYFLIKGKGDESIIQNLFGKLADEEGISLDRLRFLDRDIDEYTHRANLAIADIVLDTFPYNGATTTLETLWMGIPMVTQVGQQFSARNSYTFMLNAGITEGIAWSEQEYIDWGIKLGLDRELRWQIKGKLHAARATAPVWNAKQFTLDMEQAYREMWAKYQAQQEDDAIDLHENN
jgi:predicted O-linked N-acetylglucosamine transferase (SPINDLY family)